MLEPPEQLTVPEAPFDALAWRLPADAVGVSSAVVGGGWSRPGWILNVQVERGSARTDVEAHVAAIAT
ncbi:MAG: adenosylcobinamide amidohydrolase, partial [Actinomycetota bacterium]